MLKLTQKPKRKRFLKTVVKQMFQPTQSEYRNYLLSLVDRGVVTVENVKLNEWFAHSKNMLKNL